MMTGTTTHITWDEGAGTEIAFALGQKTIKTLCGARVGQRSVNNLTPTCESCRTIRQRNVEADAQLVRDLAPTIKRLGLKL